MFLVTGANGFVGRVLCAKIAAEGREAIACVRKRTSSETDARIRWVEVGQMDGNTNWMNILPGVHTVFHLAARAHVLDETMSNPLPCFRRTNVDASAQLVRSAIRCGVKRFVFVSSIGVNGNTSGHAFTEIDDPRPTEAYSISKWEAEQQNMFLCRDSGMELVIVRPPLVYGPGCPGNFRRLLNLVNKGLPLPFGQVNNRRSFIGVGNLADFLFTCAVRPVPPISTFVVSDGEDISLVRLLGVLAEGMEKRLILLPVPPSLLKGVASLFGRSKIYDKICGDLYIDSSLARRTLQWNAPKSLDDGLIETARWFQRHGSV
ncbi:MAG TPA: NAD-dependent epimerase/dehydratase family protein [Opitutaceae bacterium]|nr:NAD-dependent epimerase/dehydratase family protein [Opitutaceae bacterium]